MDSDWKRVVAQADLGEELLLARVADRPIALGYVDGDLVAFDAFCPHMRGPMVRAETDGKIVSCPLHGWRFDLAEGGRELHGYRGLQTYPVKVDGGEVFVLIEPDAGEE